MSEAAPADAPQICVRDHCGGSHYHPITGAPPDYHYEDWVDDGSGRGTLRPVKQPRWRDPYKRGKDRAEWWFSAAEIAREYGVAARTVRRWLQMGAFPGAVQTPGGKWRVQGKAIVAHLAGQSTHAPTGRRVAG